MTGRRRQSLSPTLFPFLAVLVCTLGTLILLLALVARNTSDTAQRIAEQPPEVPQVRPGQLTVGQVRDLVEEEAFRLEQLVSFRDGQTADLESRRDQLAHVEDHMRRIRERLDQLGQALEAAHAQEAVDEVSDQDLTRLRNRVAAEELELKNLQDEIKTQKPRFIIVPHKGPNGTDRRPIYLECTAEGVTIWPEGVQVSAWHLKHSSSDANPLDEALRAARYHALQNYGDQVPPYPMLIVRPDGVDTYSDARAALREWDDQFGYELVPAEVELAYTRPDPEMKKRIAYAVEQASNRVMQYSVARSASGNSGRYGFRPGGAGTAAGAASGNPPNGQLAVGAQPAKRMPRLSVSQMDREGRRSGYRDHRAFPSYNNYTRRPSASSGYSDGAQVSVDQAKQRLERQFDESAGAFPGSQSEPGSQGEPGSRGQGEPDLEALTAVDQIAAAGAEQRSGTQPKSDESMLLMPASDSDDASNLGGISDVGRSRRGNDQVQNNFQDNPLAFGPKGGASGMQNQPTDPSQAASSNQAVDPSVKLSSPPSGAQAPNQSQRVQPGGTDWALPNSVSGARGLEIIRPIGVEVYPDRFVLRPGSSRLPPQTFAFGPEGVGGATIELATAVRDRIKQWGAAAPGARWSPQLKVQVTPGAENRFAQLQHLMTGSGLPIERTAAASQTESNQQGERR